jgi:hypothetical protein
MPILAGRINRMISPGADGDANADFLDTSSHEFRHDSIQSDRRQDQSRYGEEPQQQ